MERNKMQDERIEFLAELMLVETIVEENPCGMKSGLFSALKEVLHSFIGKQCLENASREQVARYLGKDVRTLSRWREQYDDFPKPNKDVGHKEISFNWLDIVKWKLTHKELFEE